MTFFRWKGARAVARKEIRHIRRDPFTLVMAVGMPMVFVVFFGFILDFDVKDIRLAVADRDQTAASRGLVESFTASGYFRRTAVPRSPEDSLERGESRAGLYIETGFASELARGSAPAVQVLIDGADNQTAGVIVGYLSGVEAAAARRWHRSYAPAFLRSRFMFNEELSTRWFVVTGLFVVVMGVLTVLLTALTVAREWETGSMELLLATPATPLEIILGKLIPYLVLSLVGLGLIYVSSRAVFGIPFRGSMVYFLAVSAVFLVSTLSQGLLISVLTRQQQLAMQFSNLTGLLPATLLSGFIFPVESMPRFFQWITVILPARHFLSLCRGIILKGAGLSDMWVPTLALVGLAGALLMVAVRKFKRDLEG